MIRTLKFRSRELKTFKGFKEFTFVGDSASKASETYGEQLNLDPNSEYLINTDPGKSLLVMQICGAKNIVRQLRGLNFRPGQKVELVNKTPNGSVVVSLNNKLIGMGNEIAQNIVVTLAS